MKMFSVEFCRTSYVNIAVEAETAEQAETLAWEELDAGESYGITGDADWQVESIAEDK
jgi:hypothetical protein